MISNVSDLLLCYHSRVGARAEVLSAENPSLLQRGARRGSQRKKTALKREARNFLLDISLQHFVNTVSLRPVFCIF